MALITGEIARIYNDLVVINKAAIKGYQEAAGLIGNPDLKAELLRYSTQRTRYAEELEAQARALGVEPPSEESTVEGAITDVVAAFHRGWLSLTTAVSDPDYRAILSECETGDAAALASYELALGSDDLPPDTRALLTRQHDEIRLIKNHLAARRSQPQ